MSRIYSTVEENPTLVNTPSTNSVMGNNITSDKVKTINRSYYLTMEGRMKTSFMFVDPISIEKLYIQMVFSSFDNGQIRIDLWESVMPFLMLTTKGPIELKQNELVIDQCNQSLIDAMVQEKIIKPPHRTLNIQGKTLSVTTLVV